MPSRASGAGPISPNNRLSTMWACRGFAMPSERRINCLETATATAAVDSAISDAIARAAGNSSSGGRTLRTRPPASASSAVKIRPVSTHSNA